MTVPYVVVTRGAQITLTKEVRDKLRIREGDTVTLNVIGDVVLVTKRDPAAWRRTGDFLPDNFEKVLGELRKDATDRFRRLGIA